MSVPFALYQVDVTPLLVIYYCVYHNSCSNKLILSEYMKSAYVIHKIACARLTVFNLVNCAVQYADNIHLLSPSR
jgi:hypothetical protein